MLEPAGQASIVDDEPIAEEFASRLRELIGVRQAATIARSAGMRPQLLDKYLKGTMPGADKAIRLARALEVSVEWLITGADPARIISATAPGASDWITVGYYELADLADSARPFLTPLPVQLRRDWLTTAARLAARLWLTQLPATLVPGVCDEGDSILCTDASEHNAEGTYLYFYNGVPLVRRFQIPRPGDPKQLTPGWEADEPSGMRIVGRILGSIKVRPC